MKTSSAFDPYSKAQIELWLAVRLSAIRFALCFSFNIAFQINQWKNPELLGKETKSHKLVTQER